MKATLEDLPAVGNQPRVDENSGRWWYDVSASPYDFPGEEVTYGQLRRRLDKKVAKLLTKILEHRTKAIARAVVQDAEHRKHSRPDALRVFNPVKRGES